MKTKLAIAAVIASAIFLPSLAQDDKKPDAASPAPAAKSPPEFQIAVDIARTYEAAYNKADVKTIIGLYAPDAEYIEADGGVVSGRDAIEKAIKDNFEENPGSKLEVQVENVRLLGPGIFAERGSSLITNADGTEDAARYFALHTLHDGKWLITQITETPPPPSQESAGDSALRDLDWTVGTWEDEGAGLKTSVKWSENQAFLVREFEVHDGDDITAKGHEIVGWDPANDRVRSWIFDTSGGFGESIWIRDGNHWHVYATNTLPDGTIGTAQHILTKIDDDHAAWESVSRTLDGEILPNLPKVNATRVK